MTENDPIGWEFLDKAGTFSLPDPQYSNYLYFPLANEAGIFSSITPTLNGDIKADQNTFLSMPVSVEDLHNSRAARNFWVYVEGVGPWSVTGNSAAQLSTKFTGADTEQVTLEAGFLWQRILRQNSHIGLQAEVVNFVPAGPDKVELMKVTLTNLSDHSLHVFPTAAIPIFGRSAENLRDHRHVTSLLHRIRMHRNGVITCPTLSFDERGHQPNQVAYAVFGATGEGYAPQGFFPVVEDFIGGGGTLDWPEAVVQNLPAPAHSGDRLDGYEVLGGLRFKDEQLASGASKSYVLIQAILDSSEESDRLVEQYGRADLFDDWLLKTKLDWHQKLDALSFHTGDSRFDGWMRWVTLQPILRRLFGNSYLPYHDYGRGGRGWRDLWQDILSLLLMQPGNVGEMLFGNFGGVRIDGSNATIIGSQPGEFKADRNNIPRVWMDHGAWPFLTTRLYIDQTGDLAFLLRPQVYFKDHLVERTRSVDQAWHPDQGTLLKTASGDVYQGTILEHILIQHLTPFFNVGEHNNILLEGADWNDAMDMGRHRGESVAFTAFYASNLRQLSMLVLALKQIGAWQVELAEEITMLLDRLGQPVNYDSVTDKQTLLKRYYTRVNHTLTGKKIAIRLVDLAADLSAKAGWLFAHLRSHEWVTDGEGNGWFNGYYDDDGQRVEGDHPLGVRMTLTGQVFALMGGIASDDQVGQVVRSADRYLYDPAVGGYRLNTNFGAVLLNLGRAFGFAFGHKENGAMFSHMAVMYASALYQRGLASEGYKVLEGIYRHCQDFGKSRMYPGLPEYINPKGRGLYPYLTGSASWYLLTMVTQVFGVRGRMGDLELSPGLVTAQFDQNGEAGIITLFANQKLEVVYHNPHKLDFGNYRITAIEITHQSVNLKAGETPVIPRADLAALPSGQVHRIDVYLDTK